MILPGKVGGPNKWKLNLSLLIIFIIIAAALISWVMVTKLAASKADYSSDIRSIDNTIGHIKDSTSSLDNFTSYQNEKIQELDDNTQQALGTLTSQLTDTNNQVNDAQNRIDDANTAISKTQNDLSGVKGQADRLTTQTTQMNTQLTAVSQKADTTKTSLDSLTTKVNNLAAGLQITPTTSSGTITLVIKADVAQSTALRIDFRPTTDLPQLPGMETSLQALYAAPPVTMDSPTVRGDYTLYWSTGDSLFHLGFISFVTPPTSLAAGSNTKTISFTTSDTFEILITPVAPTGTSSGSW